MKAYGIKKAKSRFLYHILSRRDRPCSGPKASVMRAYGIKKAKTRFLYHIPSRMDRPGSGLKALGVSAYGIKKAKSRFLYHMPSKRDRPCSGPKALGVSTYGIKKAKSRFLYHIRREGTVPAVARRPWERGLLVGWHPGCGLCEGNLTAPAQHSDSKADSGKMITMATLFAAGIIVASRATISFLRRYIMTAQ